MNYSPTYSDLYDPAFPQSLLDTRVELNLGGTWTDVSAFVYERDRVTVTYGHPDETTACNPTRAALTLGNRDGRFSPRNPNGAYYTLIGRNTPMRISVPQGASYLRLEQDTTGYASCPASANTEQSGSIDVRIDLELTNYGQCSFASVYNAGTSQRSWDFGISASGYLFLRYTTSGGGGGSVSATAPLTLVRGVMRVTLDATTGNVAFYTAPAGGIDTGPWTQVGTTIAGSGAITLFASASAPLVVGYNANLTPDHPSDVGPQGSVYDFELRSGIGGSVVARVQASAMNPGVGFWTDSAGNTWAIGGSAEISNRRYRAHTEVPAWPPRWDPTGNDIYAPIEGSGLLRRYQQGTPPKLSALYRGYALLAGTGAPVAYWPCEDGTQSSTIASGLASGSPMTVVASANGPTFAGDSGFACSQPIPTLGGSTWIGQVSTSQAWLANTLRFLLHVPASGDTNNGVIARMYSTGTIARTDLVYTTTGNGTLTINAYSASGSLLGTVSYNDFATTGVSGTFATGCNGLLLRVDLDLQTSGSSVIAQSQAYAVEAWAGTLTTVTMASASLGAVTSVQINPGGLLAGSAVGHVSVQRNWESLFDLLGPVNAWLGENAGTRFARLCSEQGVNCRVYGFPTDTVAMGYQDVNDFVSLLQECEDADQGLIFEPKQTLGLGYRTRVSMFNQAAKLALTYTAAQLSAPVEPTDDDQQVRNDYTVTRAGASSTRAYLATGALSIQAPPNGVGEYGQSKTLSLGADTQLPDAAGWLVHMGTVDDVRYPQLSVDLARSEMAALYYTAQDVQVGDRLTVASTPGFLPPDGASQVIRGGTEVCYGFVFTEQWNCAPESPYRVAVFDDPVLGVADTDGSTLFGPTYSPTATSLQVATTGAATGSPLWTTSAGDFPFDIEVAGERMTVTNITGASSPQTFTVTRSVNGVVKSQYAGADVRLFQPAILSM